MKSIFRQAFEGKKGSSPMIKLAKDDIDRMVRCARAAFGNGGAQAFAEAFRAIASHGEEISKSLIIWVEVIARLVQASEKEYPNGRGQLKKSVVKSALHSLIRDSKIEIPAIPTFLRPFVLDAVTDISIEIVFKCTTTYGLWNEPEPPKNSIRAWLDGFFHVMQSIAERVFFFFAGIVAFVWTLTQSYVPLPPELKAALKSVADEGLLQKKADLVKGIPEALNWLEQNEDHVIALIQLVFEGIDLVERFDNMSGKDKKNYVVALIVAALDELGFGIGDGLMSSVIEVLLGGTIDAFVQLFHRYPVDKPYFGEHKTKSEQALVLEPSLR